MKRQLGGMSGDDTSDAGSVSHKSGSQAMSSQEYYDELERQLNLLQQRHKDLQESLSKEQRQQAEVENGIEVLCAKLGIN